MNRRIIIIRTFTIIGFVVIAGSLLLASHKPELGTSDSALVYAASAENVGLTSGRLNSIAGLLLGLLSILLGWRSLQKKKATLAIFLGLIAAILSIIHLVRVSGDFGTGSGKLGAIIALLMGLTGMVLGGISKVRKNS